MGLSQKQVILSRVLHNKKYLVTILIRCVLKDPLAIFIMFSVCLALLPIQNTDNAAMLIHLLSVLNFTVSTFRHFTEIGFKPIEMKINVNRIADLTLQD